MEQKTHLCGTLVEREKKNNIIVIINSEDRRLERRKE
jgi:hypothetical protein